MGGEICPKTEYNLPLQISMEVYLDTFSWVFDFQIPENTFMFFKHNAELVSYRWLPFDYSHGIWQNEFNLLGCVHKILSF